VLLTPLGRLLAILDEGIIGCAVSVSNIDADEAYRLIKSSGRLLPPQICVVLARLVLKHDHRPRLGTLAVGEAQFCPSAARALTCTEVMAAIVKISSLQLKLLESSS
jgi:hypothetical protein